MSYIDAIKSGDFIHVVERNNGNRIYKEYPTNYTFYYDDPRGKYTTIYGTKVSRVTPATKKEFDSEVKMHRGKRLWESDVNLVFRCLSENYADAESPKLHTAIFDIEVDFDKERGYSEIDDPFNAITAITVYLDWLDKLVTMAVPPKTMTMQEAEAATRHFSDCFLFDSEIEMLETFLDLIDDADVLTGWNSETYDIPYTINRIVRVMSKNDVKKFCLWGQNPKSRTFERFGKEQTTYDLVGRIHLDYMQLYRAYTYEERHSYSLDAIGEYEKVGNKVAYSGTLDQLYNQDFQKFIDYNRQDVMIIAKLDKKLNFLDITNQLAHDNTVLLPTTLGAVAVSDQAIINEAHSRELIVPNRIARDEGENTAAVGAWVAKPKQGMHRYIGAIDLNSLYPSDIRALNMSPETIVGQIRHTYTDPYIDNRIKNEKCSRTEAWEGLFACLEYSFMMERDAETPLIVDWEEGHSTQHTAAELYTIIFNSGADLAVSANGTIFRQDIVGVIPGLLSRWYSDRQAMQAKKANATDPVEKAHWDKRQHVKKINLNSVYGALLNAGCRFFDQRLGQSTTLTGRSITKHMASTANQLIAGEYDHEGVAIAYGDTDSSIGTTMHYTSFGHKEVQELFASCSEFWNVGEKEYAYHPDLMVMSYDPDRNQPYFSHINYIYRHKVTKDLYEIEDQDGNVVTVTEDHSVMVERNGHLVEVKPADILESDCLISIKVDGNKEYDIIGAKSALKNLLLGELGTEEQYLEEVRQIMVTQDQKTIELKKAPVKSIRKVRKAEDEYVYDIGMKNSNKPWYFGNDILIHNSCYFSAWPVIEKDVKSGKMAWSNEVCIQLYDNIAEEVNNSFPGFMQQAFNCTAERSKVIKCGRELVGSTALFITKKRYAILVIDKEGERLDVNGKPGKVKAMGLDLRRSDTPPIVQEFLSEILLDTLTDKGREEVIKKIIAFKTSFRELEPWKKGTPKRVNNLTKYTAYVESGKKATIPGHVRAAINWNTLRKINNDNWSPKIVDGMKTIVCKLKDNPMGITSVGIPTDMTSLPEWYTELPFDDDLMEDTIVDKKINNLLGVMHWKLKDATDVRSSFNSFFTLD